MRFSPGPTDNVCGSFNITKRMELLAKLLGILLGLCIAGVILLVLNVIPWALWNYAVAPTFGWPHAGFWQVFFICWAVSFVARLIRGK